MAHEHSTTFPTRKGRLIRWLYSRQHFRHAWLVATVMSTKVRFGSLQLLCRLNQIPYEEVQSGKIPRRSYVMILSPRNRGVVIASELKALGYFFTDFRRFSELEAIHRVEPAQIKL